MVRDMLLKDHPIYYAGPAKQRARMPVVHKLRIAGVRGAKAFQGHQPATLLAPSGQRQLAVPCQADIWHVPGYVKMPTLRHGQLCSYVATTWSFLGRCLRCQSKRTSCISDACCSCFGLGDSCKGEPLQAGQGLGFPGHKETKLLMPHRGDRFLQAARWLLFGQCWWRCSCCYLRTKLQSRECRPDFRSSGAGPRRRLH